jgi:Helix-turn-helix domain
VLENSEMLTLADASKITGVTVRRLRYALRTGEVKGSRPFGRYLVPASEIERLRNQKPPPPTASARA